MGYIILSPMAAEHSHPMRKLPFNKAWVSGTEVGGNGTFQGILALSTFPVKTDNNPLTYIMTTPNFDAISH